MSTEYELLKRNERYGDAQKTLEEIFLALQAYRRLDITANCLVKKRYDEITAGIEVENCVMPLPLLDTSVNAACLCPEKYDIGPCNDNYNHFDTPCWDNCPGTPDLSGYSGFFIREDATQDLEALHDPSEDKWNIDLVGSGYAMAQSPPCDAGFSEPCYVLHEGRFLSSDQMFAMMMGLAMVKRFVPAGASVTTCAGEVFQPLSIAQSIAKGLVDLPDNAPRRIFWPGSVNCRALPVQFDACNGGNLQFLYAGLEYMYNYIDPENKKPVKWWDEYKWWQSSQISLPPYGNNGNGNFVLEAMAVAKDWDNLDPNKKIFLTGGAFIRNREIFLLMNFVVFSFNKNSAL